MFRCTVCQTELGDYGGDYKRGCVVEEIPVAKMRILNVENAAAGVVARRFACGGCGTAVAVDIQFADEPLLPKSSFTTAA